MHIIVKYRDRLVAVGLALAVLLGSGIWFLGVRTPACAVIIDGKEVARVKNSQMLNEAVAHLKKAESERIQEECALATTIAVRRVSATREELVSTDQLEDALKDRVRFKTKAVWVIVDGKKVLAVKDKKTGRELLDRLRQQGVAVDQGEKLKWAVFEQKVAFLSSEVNTDKVLNLEDAMKVMINGSKEPLKYEVKQGDTLWAIARAHHTYVADLMRANKLENEHLKLGQQLLIPTSHPYVTVVAKVEGTRVESLPYETKVITSRQLASRQVKVKQEGKEGTKRVTYEVVKKNGTVVSSRILAENVIKKPVDKIVVKGTRARYSESYQVASRGIFSLGGSWLTPVFGRITCGYGGYRGHTGMDIGAKVGTAVRAAKGGQVIFAGYSGGYGKNVVISHGDGIKTRYAHLSKIYVSKGEKVAAGEVIGAVGMTGRTTGPHLHFEVIKNGGFVNPASVLR